MPIVLDLIPLKAIPDSLHKQLFLSKILTNTYPTVATQFPRVRQNSPCKIFLISSKKYQSLKIVEAAIFRKKTKQQTPSSKDISRGGRK